MRKVVVVVLLLLFLTPAVASAVDVVGCDVWLASGNVVMWAACRVAEWIAFNDGLDDWLWEIGLGQPS